MHRRMAGQCLLQALGFAPLDGAPRLQNAGFAALDQAVAHGEGLAFCVIEGLPDRFRRGGTGGPGTGVDRQHDGQRHG